MVATYQIPPDASRGMGTVFIMSKGGGKTTTMTRVQMMRDFARGIPLICLDPLSTCSQQLIDQCLLLPKPAQAAAFRRLRYFDLSGRHGLVPVFPLYYKRHAHGTLSQIAQAFPHTVARLSPELQQAPVMGQGALDKVAMNVGVLLAGLNLQITEAELVLANPAPFLAAVPRTPETEQAIAFFTHQYPHTGRENDLLTNTFRAKLNLFAWEPMRAIFGGGMPSIDWAEVEEQRLAVLLDMGGEDEQTAGIEVRWKLLWVFRDVLQYLVQRGPGRYGREPGQRVPIALYIDELTALLGSEKQNVLLENDLDALFNRYGRNMGIWTTVTLQELHQCSARLQRSLLTVGNLCLGSTTNVETSLLYSKRFTSVDYHHVKWVEENFDARGVIHTNTSFYTKEEQWEQASRRYRSVPAFQCYQGISAQEGTMPTTLTHVTVAPLLPDLTVDQELLTQIKHQLLQRDSRRIADIQAEIAHRQVAFAPAGRVESATWRARGSA